MRKYILCAMFLFALVSFAFGDEDLTPVSYQVTVTKMEFYNSDTAAWITVAQGPQAFDIAAVNAGQSVGAYAANAILPSGTYTKMRCVILRDIKVKAYSLISGYYTTTDQMPWIGGTNGKEIVIAHGADPAGSAQLGTLHAPDEANNNAPAGETSEIVDSNSVLVTWAAPMFTAFTYTNGTSKKLRMGLNITNKVTFIIPGDACNTEAPVITITAE